LAETYPEAVKEAKKHTARIYFVDEAEFRSDAHRGTTWGKKGETPVVKDSGGRLGFKLISAVSARGDMHFGWKCNHPLHFTLPYTYLSFNISIGYVFFRAI